MAFCREAGLLRSPNLIISSPRRAARPSPIRWRRRPPGTPTPTGSRRHGTVGAVARDAAGGLSAATSTGGMTGKLPGRVGDSPIIGAGTYADDATCAVSATGHGEFFIRYAVAHEISARIAHKGQPLCDAAEAVVAELARVGGSGGLVAVSRDGDVALPFNCAGMYRGYVKDDGIVYTAIYDEPFRSHNSSRAS